MSLLVPPPEVPYLGGGTWEGLFEELGTRLPDEYVALMDRYGVKATDLRRHGTMTPEQPDRLMEGVIRSAVPQQAGEGGTAR